MKGKASNERTISLDMDKHLTKISKFCAKYLRHAPEEIGIELETGGWVRVDKFLAAAKEANFPIKKSELDEVVAEAAKRRYEYDESGQRIRAVQGHSTQVDMQYQPVTPPEVLYHGTPKRSLDIIFKEGLKPMSRQYVHLSQDLDTALTVGARRGEAAILEVKALDMQKAGFEFYQAKNGVWLTKEVPSEYLSAQFS